MRSHETVQIVVLLPFLFLLAAGCTTESPVVTECVTSLDCPYGQVCQDHVCIDESLADIDEFADGDIVTDADIDADKETDVLVDGDVDRDSAVDTDAQNDVVPDVKDGDSVVVDKDVPPADEDALIPDDDSLPADEDALISDDDTLLPEEDQDPGEDDVVVPDDASGPEADTVIVDDAVVPDQDTPPPPFCGDGKDILPDGLKLYLRMNETGGTTAYDLSAGPVNGTFTAGASLGNGGARGNALAFNQNSNFQVTDTAKLDLPGSMSVAAWVNLPDNGAGNTRPYLVIGKGSGHQANFAMWREANRTISFVFHNWIVDGIVCGASSTTNPIDDGAWRHVVGTYDGTYARIYVNGLLEATSDPCVITPLVNDHPVTIGQVAPAFLYTDPYTGTGYIDDVRIYDRVLTDGEIITLKDVYEYCDDGDTEDGDGCSGVCEVEAGWTCATNALPTDCYRECVHSIYLSDSSGDGWDGATIDVAANGVNQYTGLTLVSGSGGGWYNYTVRHGASESVVYTAAGNWPYECSFEIRSQADGGGTTLFSGAYPNAYSGVANCP